MTLDQIIDQLDAAEKKATKGEWKSHHAIKPDNTGGFDCAIYDENKKIIAETFQHVGRAASGYDARPANDNADFIALARNHMRTLIEAVRVMDMWAHDCMDRDEYNDMKDEIAGIEAKHGND